MQRRPCDCRSQLPQPRATLRTLERLHAQNRWRCPVRGCTLIYQERGFFNQFSRHGTTRCSSQQVGNVAKLGETCKHKAVPSHYDVSLHRQYQIVPFILETSSSMRASATKFLWPYTPSQPNPRKYCYLVASMNAWQQTSSQAQLVLCDTYLTLCGDHSRLSV